MRKSIKSRIILSLYLTAIVFSLSSCSSHKDAVPLSEFIQSMDSVGAANNVRIFVAPNQYKIFGISRKSFEGNKRYWSKFFRDTSAVYTITMEGDDHFSVASRKGSLEDVMKRYWAKEEQRKHRRNLVPWSEFRDSVYKINPNISLVPKQIWRKTKLLRSDLAAELSKIRSFEKIGKNGPVTYMMEKGKDGIYRTVRRVNDSVGLARMNAIKYRWNSVANGMLGAAYTEEPYVGLIFGADGYRLSDTELLWLKVYASKCYPFPESTPQCEVKDYNAYVMAMDSTGKKRRVYVKVRDPHFRLLQNPPFKYTFTANFQYDGRWYYVFLCDDPLKCECKPIDVQQKNFPSL